MRKLLALKDVNPKGRQNTQRELPLIKKKTKKKKKSDATFRRERKTELGERKKR